MLKDSQKRKYEKRNRSFKMEWEDDWTFTMQGDTPLCLVSKKLLNQKKGSNVKRHHETNHKNFSRDYLSKSQLRKIKLAELKSSLQNLQTFMTAFSKEADVITEASFLVAWNIARAN